MHAHVSLQDALEAVDARSIEGAETLTPVFSLNFGFVCVCLFPAGIIACPCCNWDKHQSLVFEQPPTITYKDTNLRSTKNEIRVWIQPRPLPIPASTSNSSPAFIQQTVAAMKDAEPTERLLQVCESVSWPAAFGWLHSTFASAFNSQSCCHVAIIIRSSSVLATAASLLLSLLKALHEPCERSVLIVTPNGEGEIEQPAMAIGADVKVCDLLTYVCGFEYVTIGGVHAKLSSG